MRSLEAQAAAAMGRTGTRLKGDDDSDIVGFEEGKPGYGLPSLDKSIDAQLFVLVRQPELRPIID